ncbi:MAG: hypothetical protein RBR97_06710 [Bacteroidales bacterium]|nr:hypothetical protein [Bacteroidales bacterium]
MKKYLYGAAVQGIQSFIFGTNKLQDIVGASELVNEICDKAFEKFEGSGKSIVRAAGNIKHIFTEIHECEKAVREFPKKVMEIAPGITISQAVVTIETDFEEAVNLLEEKLKVQRNRPYNSTTLGLTGIRRARNTGMPAVKEEGKDYLDIATLKKRKVAFNANSKLCSKIFGDINKIEEKITLQVDKIPSKNDWIAVIHADGNGLGLVVQKIGKDENLLKEFSENLNEATVNAAQEAYKVVNDKYKLIELDFIPIRPIVLGGDDLTIICRADVAIEFTRKFLEEFENQTKQLLGDVLKKGNLSFDKLTACAGISFMKSSFPFYYGYNLAEDLCKKAKEDAKDKNRLQQGLAPSCLMYYKIQDSFIERFDDLIERELTASGTSFKFGPYYLDETKDRWTIDKLIEVSKELNSKEGNALKSHYREWISVLFENSQLAQQKLKRMKTTFEGKKVCSLIKELESQKRDNLYHSPVYDVISLHTVINQETDNTKTK